MLRNALLILALAFVLAGCATAQFSEKAHRDLVYANPPGGPLKFDLYLPAAAEPPPVIVWFHGGGWKFGDKRYRLLIRDLTAEGFAVATVQYRLSSRAKWPAQREDGLAALRWLRTNSPSLGINANRMGLAGDSAGGHLASLIGLTENKPRIRAVLAIYPPTDLVMLAGEHVDNPKTLIADLLGGPLGQKPDAARDASPVKFVTAKAPPFLFLHGDRDRVVPLTQSQMLYGKLLQAGVETELLVVKGKGHAFRLDREQLKAAAAFFRSNLMP